AQCKDVGLVATETGYNLYVCGNGGAKPRHAELLATDLDEDTAVRYIDRFMIYYIRTADKLNRTAVWVEKMEGGIEHLKKVIIDDSLGICDELEEQMKYLVATYKCEWKEVVNDPEKRKLFRQFVNTDESEPGIEIVAQRDQQRPADWPKDFVPISSLTRASSLSSSPDLSRSPSPATNGRKPAPNTTWIKVGITSDFPKDGGATIKYGEVQLAVYFTSRGEWYACQNMCPHKNAFVLSRGIIGNAGETPKVSCPLHKKPFSLQTGESLSGEDFSVKVFPVKVEGDEVFLLLPPKSQLDALLSTDLHCVRDCREKKSAEPECVPV
ncbi:MAG TPA: nitrite reductase small subunit NirD, partial [Pirellulaceae bacterium]|nr:nitrite reductase small subunit NirD [Pirellulaceae bacterium]